MLTDDLLELQRLDTAADQLAHRRATLPERDRAAAADAALADNRRRRSERAARHDRLEVDIGALERDGAALGAQRDRLERQLKTVVAPREAEALLHELATVATRRDELDDQELAHLDEQSTLADEIVELDGACPDLEAQAAAARLGLTAVEADVEGELAAVTATRDELRRRLDAAVLDRYERLRARLGGVAVARLEGGRCGGCHLDLSTTEIAAVRAVDAGTFADCPNCGRLLAP